MLLGGRNLKWICFRDKNDAFAKLWIRLGTLSGLYWGVGDLITGLQVVTIIVLGAAEAVNGSISAGEFVAFASYNTTLVWPTVDWDVFFLI